MREHVQMMTLGTVATYINGRAFKPAEWETSGLPIIRIQNLTSSTTQVNYTTQRFEDKYLVHNGDLLFAWSASLGAHIWNGEDAWLNQHIFRVVPNEGMKYKIDGLAALKEKGYNTNRLRKEDQLSETVIHSLRHNQPISWKNIEKVCVVLGCQPGDILILEGGQDCEE